MPYSFPFMAVLNGMFTRHWHGKDTIEIPKNTMRCNWKLTRGTHSIQQTEEAELGGNQLHVHVSSMNVSIGYFVTHRFGMVYVEQ